MKKKELLSAMKRVDVVVGSFPRVTTSTRGCLIDGSWVDPLTGDETLTLIAQELDAARAAPAGWSRCGSSAAVAFWFADLNAAIKVDFVAKPHSSTVQKFRKQLNEELQNARNEYRANHDQWTGCLNKTANDRALLSAVAKINGSSVSSAGVGVSAAVGRAYLLALDLDHFKTVNDRFGHLYGDLVLRVFSARVDQVCSQWMVEHEDLEISVVFSRPGGEEFQILVEGNISQDAVLQLGARINKVVGGRELPTDEEYAALRKDGRCDEVDLPLTKHRGITVSIGVAVLAVRSGLSEKELVARLQRDADRALYSAKSGGRDCVRLFSDLLRKFGRVVASHASTNLVAIDIGSDVGVELGQEFLVFPPDFVGGVPYVVGEGRSRKQIGEFPRYAVARISAVEVQPELAFCKAESWNIGVTEIISPGSFLEAIPLGSISHLITKPDAARSPGLVAIETVRKKLSGSVAKIGQFVVGVRIFGLRKFAADRGFAAANKLLALIYAAISDSQDGRVEIASVAEDSFVFVPTGLEGFDQDVREELKASLLSICRDKVKVGVGSFFSSDFPETKVEFGVELSLMAASASGGDDVVQFVSFSDSAAAQVLYKARISEQYESARADMLKLREMGVRLPRAMNQIGLVDYTLGDYEQAAAWFEEACELEPDLLYTRLNLGLAAFHTKEWQRSFDAFKRVEELAYATNKEFDGDYLGAFVISARRLQKDHGLVSRAEVERLLSLALSADVPQFFGVDKEVLGEFSKRFSAESA